MFWADRIAKEIEATRPNTDGSPLLIRDEKTLSGRVHIGSMRGVAIHGLISEVLSEYGIENTFRYELNDFDPFDAIPGYLDAEKYTEHLGKPLYLVPSPEPGYKNYPEYFGAEFTAVHAKAGFHPEYYWAHADLYAAGKMDPYIKIALERASDVRRILKDVSGSVKDDTWLPISVVCESCQKIMTTRVYDFDGETVGYSCDKSPDTVVPCGHEGRIAPWKGNAKLFWKVDWAAKWIALGVSVEGGGKDHSTKGGARDVANHISRELFGYQSPFDIPYEFLLVGGKKMSSSKGSGSSSKDIADLFPPAVLRLALLGKDISQQVNFEPEGDSVPRWYDWYDDLCERARGGVADDFTRLFTLSQVPEDQAEPPMPWQLRFAQVAFIVQMPHLSLEDEAARIKGIELTEEERVALEERAAYARFWLSTYAPEQYRYELQETCPPIELSPSQKKALGLLGEFMAEEERTGEQIHERLHTLKSEVPIEPKELFSALYHIFLGRTSGPKAGWFLSVLPREFTITRLNEASS